MWAVGILLFEILTGRHPFYRTEQSNVDQMGTNKEELSMYFHLLDNSNAQHLFNHLCNKKQSGRFSSTEALEHPWITNSDLNKFPLSYDERLLIQLLKPAMLAIAFVARTKGKQRKTKPRRLRNVVQKLTVNELKLREAKERIRRREWYSKKIKLMKDNPKLYEAIYGDRTGILSSNMTIGEALTSRTSVQELPPIKGRYSSMLAIKPVEEIRTSVVTPQTAESQRSTQSNNMKAQSSGQLLLNHNTKLITTTRKENVWERLNKRRTQLKFVY
jgi:serine/threonine protein kinase